MWFTQSNTGSQVRCKNGNIVIWLNIFPPRQSCVFTSCFTQSVSVITQFLGGKCVYTLVFVFHLLLCAAASAWPCVRGCWLRTAGSGSVWPAGTCSGPRPRAPLSWPHTPAHVWTCCTWTWALWGLCSPLLRRSRPGTDTKIQWHTCAHLNYELWI